MGVDQYANYNEVDVSPFPGFDASKERESSYSTRLLFLTLLSYTGVVMLRCDMIIA